MKKTLGLLTALALFVSPVWAAGEGTSPEVAKGNATEQKVEKKAKKKAVKKACKKAENKGATPDKTTQPAGGKKKVEGC